MFDLPPRKTDRTPQSLSPSDTATNGAAAVHRPWTVLIIEDDPGVRHLARRTLEAVGYQVLEAEDGVEGLRLVEEHSSLLDLVVTDIEMPRMDGISVARELAVKHPHIGVVCMSGRLPETTFRARIGVPLPPFLAKPFTFDDLTRTTSETIARFQERSA
jgi:Response regulator containing CheY-like receiver domain and AraC-type DNA-binding domain